MSCIEIDLEVFNQLSKKEKYDYLEEFFDGQQFEFNGYYKYCFYYIKIFQTNHGPLVGHFKFDMDASDIYRASFETKEILTKDNFKEWAFEISFLDVNYLKEK